MGDNIIASLVTIAVVGLAGVCYSIMWIISHKFRRSIFSDGEIYKQDWWNPEKSWKNKWRGVNLKGVLEEKYWGSSTVFVFTTDAFHFFQFVGHKLLFGAMSYWTNISNYWLIDFITLHVIYTVTFELFYSKVLKKK
jgi:hypothetical protein